MYVYSLVDYYHLLCDRDNTSTVESDVNQGAKVSPFSRTISSSSGAGTPKRCSTSRTNDATMSDSSLGISVEILLLRSA